MSVKSGFFDAVSTGTDEHGKPIYDREYDAEAIAKFFRSLIGTGVSAAIENCFKIIPQSGLTIAFSPGYAWIEGYWIDSDNFESETCSAAPSSGYRIDAAVLRLNKSTRQIIPMILKGVESNSPVIPTLLDDDVFHDIMCGYITFSAGMSSIGAENITDTRADASVCGIIDTFASRLVPNGSITADKLAENSVTAAAIKNGEVTSDKLSPDALDSVAPAYKFTTEDITPGTASREPENTITWVVDEGENQ